MINWIKGKIKSRRWRKIEKQSIGRYKVEYKDAYGSIYIDPKDKENVYDMFHNYLGNPEVKIIAEMLDGSSREVKLGRKIKKCLM